MRTITVGKFTVPLEEYATVSKEAAAKTMIALGIVPMAVVFFAVEALPIGVTGIRALILRFMFSFF